MQNMRDLLRANLGRSLQTMPPLDRLASAWPVASGAALAGRASIFAYEDGVVDIEVAAQEWLQPAP